MVITDKKVLIIGCGSIGKRHARILRQLGVNRLVLCDTDEEQLDAAARQIPDAETFRSFDQALKQRMDAVFICTPPGYHLNQAIQALQHGCDVFLEKPLSDSMDQIDVLEKAVHTSDRLLMVGLCFRYHQGLQVVRKTISEGQLGKLLAIRASLGEYLADCRPGADYRSLHVAGKRMGVALDLCHELDFVRWIAQSHPLRIFACSGKFSDLEIEADDLAEIIMPLKNGVLTSIHLDYFQRARRRISEYYCSEGTVIADLSDWNTCILRTYSVKTGDWEERRIAMERDDMFRAMDYEFLTSMTTRKAGYPDLTVGIDVLKMSLAVKRSSAISAAVEMQ